MQTQTPKEERQHKGTERRQPCASQGEGTGTDLAQTSEINQACQHIDFGPLASKTMRQ